MGFEILISVLLIASCHLQYGDSQILSIKDFLKSDSDTTNDYSQAFQAAWKALCGGHGASLVIKANEKYTIQPQLLQGPCVSRNPKIQIDGTLEAPTTPRDWGSSGCWLWFQAVTGLVLTGSGTLNLHGENWWSTVGLSQRPVAVRFSGCQNVLYSGLTQYNSPRNHISITSSTYVTLSHIHLVAPGDSPNTDGVDISGSHSIQIIDSSIKTGDDCVAIQGGSYDINITSVYCGPGHGISIGSLGRGGATDVVQNVNVKHCTFAGTENGARIKTWPGGRGFVKNILYEDITLINARAPIIIDQHYPNSDQANAVKVSDVTYRYFKGTSADVAAININCDQNTNCDNIVMEQINITSSSGTPLTAYCKFAHVTSRFVSIPISCGFRDNSQPPSSPAPYALTPTKTAQAPMFFPFSYVF